MVSIQTNYVGQKIRNSAPCKSCLSLLKSVGIKKLYYSTGDGDEIVCENVRDMESDHVSNGYRRIINHTYENI